MDEPYGTRVLKKRCTEIWRPVRWGAVKERDCMEELRIDGKAVYSYTNFTLFCTVHCTTIIEPKQTKCTFLMFSPCIFDI